MNRPPKDAAERKRIETDFDRNLLVEAGAGSGKTYSLASRMAAGIARGKFRIEHMAAVTFTRKAAAELRGRFQLALEERLESLRAPGRQPGAQDAEVERLEYGLANLERFYAGTIHAFCAHLLRERPVESGVAPGFTELDEAEDVRRREESWRDYIAFARASGRKELLELLAAGVKADDLDTAFKVVCLYEEVTFPAPPVPRPDLATALREARTFGTALRKLVPVRPDPDHKCSMLPRAEEFLRRIDFADQDRPSDVVRLLELCGTTTKVTFKWWEGKGREAQALLQRFRTDTAHPFLASWREYLYHLCVTVLNAARDHARADRHRRNTLNYADLLQLAAKVLRENTLVRRALQKKYRWLFVDEFQDTDPVQAEIIVRLAADEGSLATGSRTSSRATEVDDWTKVKLRPGALFVVGDPKQSIYRFRRADIDIYARVKQLIKDSGGTVVPLTANFRSKPEICTWANDVFEALFPAREEPHAPKFEALNAYRVAEPGGQGASESGIRTLTISATVQQKLVAAVEAAEIARRIRSDVDAGRRKFGDFLVLTRKKKPLAIYASALEELQIPFEVSGAGAFGDSAEVWHLALLLRALADPQDAVTLVGVLRGPLFGISDPELFEFVRAGNRLWLFAGSEPMAEPAGGTIGRDHPPESATVSSALSSLREMYRWTRVLPPAAAVERILESTGCLALAATTPDSAAAGNLLHAIDRIRQVSEDGGTLLDAVESLEEDAEGSSDVDSLPLEPGRTDVVRLMNLHKAKGLEAPVVFLADPCGGFQPRVDVRIVRSGTINDGYFQLCDRNENGYGRRIVAQPSGWDAHEQVERVYLAAELARLSYVAATRARDLLVVGRWAGTGAKCTRAWSDFEPWLQTTAPLSQPKHVSVHTAKLPDCSAGAIESAAAARQAVFRSALTASYSVTSVTASAPHVSKVVQKAEREAEADDPTRTVTEDTAAHRADAGMAWGTLIHGLLEHAMRRQAATTEELHRLAVWLTVEQPELRTVLDRAVTLVQEVSRATFWREAAESPERHVETPFATTDGRSLLMGVIDLVFRSGAAWEIVDYKTDRRSDPADNAAYAQQLRTYASAWHDITREAARTSIQHVT